MVGVALMLSSGGDGLQPRSAYDGVSRQPTAVTTALMQTTARARNQVEPPLVPLPRACSSATGHRA